MRFSFKRPSPYTNDKSSWLNKRKKRRENKEKKFNIQILFVSTSQTFFSSSFLHLNVFRAHDIIFVTTDAYSLFFFCSFLSVLFSNFLNYERKSSQTQRLNIPLLLFYSHVGCFTCFFCVHGRARDDLCVSIRDANASLAISIAIYNVIKSIRIGIVEHD